MLSKSRRSFLRTGALAAIGLGSRQSEGSQLPRVGVVGGGLSGVACGWLLDGVAETVLFESRSMLGGHADSVPVTVRGRSLFVDLGAQFFSPGTHPTYSKLLEIVGLTNPGDPARDATLEAEMTIAVIESGRSAPRFVSPSTRRTWPLTLLWNREGLLAFFLFALAAKELTRDGDWLVTVDRFLAALPVSEEQRERLLLPFVAAMTGCSIEQARGLSARSAVMFVGRALPDDLLAPFVYRNSLLGLGGNVRYLAGITGSLTTHLGSPVSRVQRRPDGGFAIRNAAGVVENVDVVVFATPPYVTRLLLPFGPGRLKASWLLRQFEYFRAEISIHEDPLYMPPGLLAWSAYNARTEGGFCEASIWYGPLHEPSNPWNLLLFKSWVTARSAAPARELHRRAFLHPYVTPRFIQTQRLLAECQGQGGVWFAGSYTREVDSQETALLSAMSVVRALSPSAPNLLALES